MESFNASWQFIALLITTLAYYLLVCGTSIGLALKARRRSTRLHQGKFQGGATVGLVLSLAFGAISVLGGIVAALAACKTLGGT